MTLEQQLQELANIGLVLNPGVTIDDLLLSYSRADYEKEPLDLILFVLGSELEAEPWGRNVCDRAWNFDTECVEGGGAYVTIVRRLCQVAGQPDALTDVRDSIDLDEPSGTLEYSIAGARRTWTIEIDDDWVDGKVVDAVMRDITSVVPGGSFYSKDNGQASIWFYLTRDQARRLRELGAEFDGP